MNTQLVFPTHVGVFPKWHNYRQFLRRLPRARGGVSAELSEPRGILRQCVKTEKNSGIVNDANDWAVETIGNAKYPLELFQRVITVSLETQKIVNSLPKMAS